MKQRPVSWWVQGWLCPRLPYLWWRKNDLLVTQYKCKLNEIYRPGLFLTPKNDKKWILLQLVSLASGGDCCQLVTKTDPENRFDLASILFQIFWEIVDGLRTHGRVTGPIAKEETVKFFGSEIVIPGDEIHTSATIQEAADLVVLETAVDGADPWKSARVERARKL